MTLIRYAVWIVHEAGKTELLSNLYDSPQAAASVAALWEADFKGRVTARIVQVEVDVSRIGEKP